MIKLGINLKICILLFGYDAGRFGIGIYSARKNTMKMFGFNFKQWFKLRTPELRRVMAYMVTKKSVEELEAEQKVILRKLDELADAPLGSLEAATNVRNLRTMNGLCAGAILSKQIGDGEKNNK